MVPTQIMSKAGVLLISTAVLCVLIGRTASAQDDEHADGGRATWETIQQDILDKKTGEVIHAMSFEVSPSAVPMTYMDDGKQYIAMAYGGASAAGVIALALP